MNAPEAARRSGRDHGHRAEPSRSARVGHDTPRGQPAKRMPHQMKPINGKRIEQCVKIIHPVLDSPRGVDQRGAIAQSRIRADREQWRETPAAGRSSFPPTTSRRPRFHEGKRPPPPWSGPVRSVGHSASLHSWRNLRSAPTRQCGKGICRCFLGRTVTRHSLWPNRHWRRLSSTCPIRKHITKQLRSKTNTERF